MEGETKVENKTATPEKKDVEEKQEKSDEKGEENTATTEPVAQNSPLKLNVHKMNFEKDVVYLYQFSRTPVIPSISPYCLKVETWLRLNAIKYECVDHKMKFRSKKGQLPFIELNGEEIADSQIIINQLSKLFDKDPDMILTSEQRVLSHAMITMLENHLVWVVFWWRSKNPDLIIKGYKVNLQLALGSRLPNTLLNIIFKFSFGRKGAKKLKAQGMGVHSEDEVINFGESDLKALSEALADKPYYFGDEPTNLDVVSFAVLAQIYFIDKEVSYALRDYMVEHCANLVGHVNRMKERCFPDWEQLCDIASAAQPHGKDTKEKEQAAQDEKEGDKGANEKDVEDTEKEKAEDNEKELEKEKESADENKEKEEVK